MTDEWPEGMEDIISESSIHEVTTPKADLSEWKVRYGGGTFVDGINGWVYHYGPPEDDTKPGNGPLIADHPWDDSFESVTCPHCGGEPL